MAGVTQLHAAAGIIRRASDIYLYDIGEEGILPVKV